MPPCATTLKKHTARANYICRIWKNAIHPQQNLDAFENNGWLPDGNIDWIDSAYPDDVKMLFSEENSTDDSDVQDNNDCFSDDDDDGGDLTDNEDD